MSAVEQVAATLAIGDGYLDSRGSLRDPQPPHGASASTSRGSLRDPQPPSSTLPIDGEDVPQRKRKRRGWAPDETDQLVYEWVKFDGLRQSEVAKLVGIDQSTVSRIVMRYEKWQAHATPATDGRLSPEERQRAQRHLTYERNERMLSSCLRLAREMEQSIDASRSVTSRVMSEPGNEREMKTEYFVIDRTQMASRFLRLAQRINMDNLKLTEQEPLPELPPLAEEEIIEQELDAAAVTREREAAEAEKAVDRNAAMRQRVDAEVAQAVEAAVAKRMKELDRERLAVVGGEADVADDHGVAVVAAAAHGKSASNSRGSLRDPQPPKREPLVIRQSNEPAVAEVQVHNLHTCIIPRAGASADVVESCERKTSPANTVARACIAPGDVESNSRGSARATPQPPLSTQPPRQEPGPESLCVIEPSEKDGRPAIRHSGQSGSS